MFYVIILSKLIDFEKVRTFNYLQRNFYLPTFSDIPNQILFFITDIKIKNFPKKFLVNSIFLKADFCMIDKLSLTAIIHFILYWCCIVFEVFTY